MKYGAVLLSVFLLLGCTLENREYGIDLTSFSIDPNPVPIGASVTLTVHYSETTNAEDDSDEKVFKWEYTDAEGYPRLQKTSRPYVVLSDLPAGVNAVKCSCDYLKKSWHGSSIDILFSVQ